MLTPSPRPSSGAVPPDADEPRREPADGTIISEHRTSQGLVRYRRWPGCISVELLGEPIAVLAAVRGTDASAVDGRGSP
jgi:hypothetical protein